MLPVALTGASVGAGIWLLIRFLWPAKSSLAEAMAAAERPAIGLPASSPAPTSLFARLALPITGLLLGHNASGLVDNLVERDLVVIGRPLERHVAEKLAIALLGLLLVPVWVGLAALGGIPLPMGFPLWGSLACAVAGWFVPDWDARKRARKRREELVYALGPFIDLTVVSLAGGSGMEEAISWATDEGDSWAQVQLRRAVDAARISRETPWDSLERLGGEMGVPELQELAASVRPAGRHGARVRKSLSARAASLRAQRLARAEARSRAKTQLMVVAQMFQVIALLLFILYPAFDRFLHPSS